MTPMPKGSYLASSEPNSLRLGSKSTKDKHTTTIFKNDNNNEKSLCQTSHDNHNKPNVQTKQTKIWRIMEVFAP